MNKEAFGNNPSICKACLTRTAAAFRILRGRTITDICDLQPVDYNGLDWQKTLEFFEYKCVVCGEEDGMFTSLSIDHWIPISDKRSPGHVPWNIIPLCHGLGGCNNSKRNRDPEIWLKLRVGNTNALCVSGRIQEFFGIAKTWRPYGYGSVCGILSNAEWNLLMSFYRIGEWITPRAMSGHRGFGALKTARNLARGGFLAEAGNGPEQVFRIASLGKQLVELKLTEQVDKMTK
ncbi:MAG: hypothetical protein WC657_06055 [Candidatus Paceibacterota bacterium]